MHTARTWCTYEQTLLPSFRPETAAEEMRWNWLARTRIDTAQGGQEKTLNVYYFLANNFLKLLFVDVRHP
jgi:hypothetical protein